MFKKIFNRGKVKSSDYSAIPLSGFLEQVFYGGRVTAGKAAEYYRQSASVAIAVDTIADEVEMIKPYVKLKDGTLTDSHPVLDLLENPNDFEDYRQLIGNLSRQYLLNRDAFIYAEGQVGRPPVNIFALKNQNVSITQNSVDRYPAIYSVNTGFGIGSYSRQTIKGKVKFYDQDFKEIFQIRGFSSRADNTFSDSPLEAAALEAQQQILGRNHNLKLITNGGRLSMAVILKGDEAPTQETYDLVQESVNRQFGGSDNAGAIGVFAASDMEVKELGQTNKDMDYANLDQTSSNCIYMRYKIPLPIVSPDRQTFNNFDRAIEDLYDRAVLPNAEACFSGLTKMLKMRYGDDFECITYNPEQIPALKGRALDELKKRKDLGVETINEIREALPNREDIDGGDKIYQPATLIPLGEDPFSDNEVDPNNAIND